MYIKEKNRFKKKKKICWKKTWSYLAGKTNPGLSHSDSAVCNSSEAPAHQHLLHTVGGQRTAPRWPDPAAHLCKRNAKRGRWSSHKAEPLFTKRSCSSSRSTNPGRQPPSARFQGGAHWLKTVRGLSAAQRAGRCLKPAALSCRTQDPHLPSDNNVMTQIYSTRLNACPVSILSPEKIKLFNWNMCPTT